MAIEINIPRLGWSMEEGTFVEWLKPAGEWVSSGELLYVLEGDKAAQDIESFDEGILHVASDSPLKGDLVRVGQRIGFLLARGELPPSPKHHQARLAPSVEATSPSVTARVAETRSAPRTVPTASPRARRLARESVVDIRSIAGTGRGGRIRARDVLAAIHLPGRLTPLSQARRTIAERMVAAVHQAAPVTLTMRIPADGLVAFRAQFHASAPANEIVPTYTDLFMKLVASVLPRHRSLWAQWHENGLFHPDELNLAFAVDTDEGLVAPVVRYVDTKSLADLATETRQLTDAARQQRLTTDQLRDGMFTVSNLGGHGIDSFTPLLNLPQSAILGVGRIRQEPAVVAGAIIPQWQVTLNLTFDHRVVDGAPAARFLQELGQVCADPRGQLVVRILHV